MSIPGLALVLAAAFCRTIWNFFVKRINGAPELIWLLSILSVAIYLPVAVWVVVEQKPVFSSWQNIFVAGSAVLHLGNFLFLQTGYRQGDLPLVYPTARATGPLLSTTFRVSFLSEVVTLRMAIGAGIIVFGVLMLTGGIKPDAKQLSASLLFGLGAGTLIGNYTAWDAYAVSALLVPPLLLDYVSSVGRVFLLAPFASRRCDQIRQQ